GDRLAVVVGVAGGDYVVEAFVPESVDLGVAAALVGAVCHVRVHPADVVGVAAGAGEPHRVREFGGRFVHLPDAVQAGREAAARMPLDVGRADLGGDLDRGPDDRRRLPVQRPHHQ